VSPKIFKPQYNNFKEHNSRLIPLPWHRWTLYSQINSVIA